MLIADDRCQHGDCVDKGAYRMVGHCLNCGAEPVLMLFTAGHDARLLPCPTCGCRRVAPERLAAGDEIPVTAGPAE